MYFTETSSIYAPRRDYSGMSLLPMWHEFGQERDILPGLLPKVSEAVC